MVYICIYVCIDIHIYVADMHEYVGVYMCMYVGG